MIFFGSYVWVFVWSKAVDTAYLRHIYICMFLFAQTRSTPLQWSHNVHILLARSIARKGIHTSFNSSLYKAIKSNAHQRATLETATKILMKMLVRPTHPSFPENASDRTRPSTKSIISRFGVKGQNGGRHR